MARIVKSLKYGTEERGYVHREHKPTRRRYHDKPRKESFFREQRTLLKESESLKELKEIKKLL